MNLGMLHVDHEGESYDFSLHWMCVHNIQLIGIHLLRSGDPRKKFSLFFLPFSVTILRCVAVLPCSHLFKLVVQLKIERKQGRRDEWMRPNSAAGCRINTNTIGFCSRLFNSLSLPARTKLIYWRWLRCSSYGSAHNIQRRTQSQSANTRAHSPGGKRDNNNSCEHERWRT